MFVNIFKCLLTVFVCSFHFYSRAQMKMISNQRFWKLSFNVPVRKRFNLPASPLLFPMRAADLNWCRTNIKQNKSSNVVGRLCLREPDGDAFMGLLRLRSFVLFVFLLSSSKTRGSLSRFLSFSSAVKVNSFMVMLSVSCSFKVILVQI